MRNESVTMLVAVGMMDDVVTSGAAYCLPVCLLPGKSAVAAYCLPTCLII